MPENQALLTQFFKPPPKPGRPSGRKEETRGRPPQRIEPATFDAASTAAPQDSTRGTKPVIERANWSLPL